MALDIPKSFVRTYIIFEGEKIIMKIRGKLSEILCGIFPGVYNKYIQCRVKQNIVYVQKLKELYSMLVSSICKTKSLEMT